MFVLGGESAKGERAMSDDARDFAYDLAQVCTNGHVVTNAAETNPSATTDHCVKCGAETITHCKACGARIRGLDRQGVSLFNRPAFCHRCGEPHPWTSSRLQAARELASLEADPEIRQVLASTIDDLVKDTPATPVAALKFKNALAKLGKNAAETFREILVDVLSETTKKALWPDAPPSRR